MLKNSLAFGFAFVSALIAGQAHAVENETLMLFNGQPNNLPLYTSATGLGTMAVNPPGAPTFSVPADHSAIMTQPGSGITTVFTPSATAVPTKITYFDQRTSTYRHISAKCLNPATQAIEPCDLSNQVLFPRTDYPAVPFPYTQQSLYQWFAAPDNFLRVSTPAGGGGQSNGGYITLPPYVREVTVTAYGSGNPDFSGADLYVADAPSVSKAFAPLAVTPGGQTTLTITVKNPGLGAPIPGMNLTDLLPAPLKVVSASHTCTGGTLAAAAGSSTLSLTGATLPTAGCDITAQLEWPGDASGIAACIATPTVSNRITPPAQFNTAIGQLNTEALAALSCSYTAPVVSVACTPTELVDSPNQQSVCTISSNTPAAAAGLNVNMVLPASNPRYTSTCATPVTIPAGQTTATCNISATANTVAGDGDVTATLTIAAPTDVNDYSIGVNPAQVVIKNDDQAGGAVAQAVPTLQQWALIALAALLAMFGASRLRRR